MLRPAVIQEEEQPRLLEGDEVDEEDDEVAAVEAEVDDDEVDDETTFVVTVFVTDMKLQQIVLLIAKPAVAVVQEVGEEDRLPAAMVNLMPEKLI